ncbi:peptidyl-glycine alpha-amidating monooxygenase isoform X2 [Amia ocellicauda]|uniref:peptidyl-glycine alpha-amidating monooxygenase isoform X2 n=1 Tax=Amia ocellicauda TaxID=2972642 RepID=UPI0034640A71
MGVLVCAVVLLSLVFQSHSLGLKSPLSIFKRYQESVLSTPGECTRSRQPVIPPNAQNFSLDIRMPGVTPTASDSYMCIAVRVPRERDSYVVDFTPHASMETAHHMILFGCRSPFSTDDYWNCGGGTCKDKANIMYAWARNAPPKKLPRDVGFKVGGDSGINYFVLQIHYGDINAFRDNHRDCSGLTLTLTSKPQPLIAGVYLLMSMDTVIPPGKKVTNADIACTYKSYPMYPFAFRTHTHHLGKVVSGYRVRDGKWTLIGRQSPQLPQAFYPVNNPVDIRYGDKLAARCVFTGEGKSSTTYIGGNSDDEMCNFYIMYYMDAKQARPYIDCIESGKSELFKNIPKEANIPIPVSPSNMMMMHGHMNQRGSDEKSVLLQPKREEEEVLDQGDFYSLLSKLLGEREDVVHVHKYNPTEKAESDLVAEIDNIVQKKDLGWPGQREIDFNERADAILVRDKIHKFHKLESTIRPPGNGIFTAKQPNTIGASAQKQGYHLVEMVDWPEVQLQLGQVSGLALDSDDNLVIFHRGDHRWGVNSFDNQRIYQQQELGPIQQSTILVVDPVKGQVLKASGRNIFYLPHGISTDKNNNYWVTDVALHQVFKLGNGRDDEPLMVLGQAFQPGSDTRHFCQPTDVAVDPVSGNVYVSDGYCNSRIIKYSPEGKYLMHWGAGSQDKRKPVHFNIPHSLAFVPDRRELCVADRENGRIQCFLAESGEFVKEIKKDEFGGEVFAVSYAPENGGLIYAVNGESAFGKSAPVKGFVINYSTREILDTFSPETQEFKMPHDIVVSRDGTVFVGDATTDTVIKFVSSEQAEHRSVKKGGIEVHEIEETETFLETNLQPHLKTQTQGLAKPKPQEQVALPEQKTKTALKQSTEGVSPAIITSLLLIPLVVVISIAVFIQWKKKRMYGDAESKLESSSSGGILGKLRGKTGGGLNLGNFFASHKGYSRKGFDRLSTEGSDQEKDDEDATDSETEEYSAPPPPPPPPPASSSS